MLFLEAASSRLEAFFLEPDSVAVDATRGVKLLISRLTVCRESPSRRAVSPPCPCKNPSKACTYGTGKVRCDHSHNTDEPLLGCDCIVPFESTVKASPGPLLTAVVLSHGPLRVLFKECGLNSRGLLFFNSRGLLFFSSDCALSCISVVRTSMNFLR